MSTAAELRPDVDTAAVKFVRWLETGEDDDVFAEDCFMDLTLPQWRFQVSGGDAVLAVRREMHPFAGKVRVERLDHTANGFVLALEERWHHEGQDWYCREQFRADVVDGAITDVAVYCTGDWDEAVQAQHAASVTLLRP